MNMIVFIGSVYVGFLMDKMVLGQVFLLSSSVLPCQYHSTMAIHTRIIRRMNNRRVSACSSEALSHPIDMNVNMMASIIWFADIKLHMWKILVLESLHSFNMKFAYLIIFGGSMSLI
jgi:hypothetical protein